MDQEAVFPEYSFKIRLNEVSRRSRTAIVDMALRFINNMEIALLPK